MPDHVGLFPNVATVEQIRDYCDWLVQTGCGKYRMEIRERFLALPPQNEAADHECKVAFLRGVL